MRIVKCNETVLIGAGEAYKPACRECHKFFSMEREKGILNIDKMINEEENKENRENMHMEEKDTKVDSSSGDESGFSSKELVSIFPNNSVPFN